MEEKEFITMLEDLIYSEQELSDDYSKATNKAIDLLNKLKAKQLSILDVSNCFDRLTDEERIEIMNRYDKNTGTRNDNCC